MTLPHGWRETEPRSNRPGTWRFQVRSPKRFRMTTLRTVPLEGIRGVKLIAGKLRPGDQELERHGEDAMVPQAVLFDKAAWPQFRDALAWQRDHFSAMDNPPRRRRGCRANPGERSAAWVTFSPIAFGVGGGPKFRLESTDPEQPSERFGTITDANRYATREGEPAGEHAMRFPWARTGPHFPVGTKKNPPSGRIYRGQLRLGSFRAGVSEAIEKLVTTETELTALMAQALELVDRGAAVPEWIRTRARGLQLERTAQLEAVKTAVARHGAVLEEFAPPASRRANPSGDRAAAVKLYREFHGAAPQSFHTQKIPDLRQLVHLGRALRVDYQAARSRGPRGTPYRHEFAAGSELFTDRTGRALVVLGNLKVSRAPRGRFGYIRAGAGA